MSITVKYSQGKFKANVRGFEVIYGAEADWGFDPVEGIIPSEYLIVSVGGCAAMHAVLFCKKHNLPTEGVKIDLSWLGNPRGTGLVEAIIMDVTVPELPKELEPRLIKDLKHCTVAASIELPPKFIVNIQK
jgi:uncharacterized OsmC-like protein